MLLREVNVSLLAIPVLLPDYFNYVTSDMGRNYLNITWHQEKSPHSQIKQVRAVF